MLNFDPKNARECFDKLRVKGVAADNEKGNAIRHILTALVSGAMGEAGLTTLVLASYGNPKTAGGKPVTTVAGLASPKNNIAGGDVMRQAWKAAFAVNELRFYPCVNGEGETEILAVPGADDVIAAFVNGDKGAPKGIYALKTAIAGLQATAMGDVAKADTPSGEGEGETPSAASDATDTATPSLADILAAVTAAIHNAKGEELPANAAGLAELRRVIDEAMDHIAASEAVDIAA